MYRIRLNSPWTGMIAGEERHVKAGEEVDVDWVTFKALTVDRELAKAVTVEEIQAKPVAKPKPKPRGRPKAQKPVQDKMIKTGENKG